MEGPQNRITKARLQLNSWVHPCGATATGLRRTWNCRPCPSTEAPQQIRKHHRHYGNSRDPMQTSRSRRAVVKTEVSLVTYKFKESSSARCWSACTRKASLKKLRDRKSINRESNFSCVVNEGIKREEIFIFRSKMDKYRCTEWAHNALNINIYLTIN